MSTKKLFTKVGVFCQLFAISTVNTAGIDPAIAPLIFNNDDKMIMIQGDKEIAHRIVSEFSDPIPEDVVELKKDGLKYVDRNGCKYKCINRGGKKYLEKNNTEEGQ